MGYDRTITQTEMQKAVSAHVNELTRRINEGQWRFVQNWQEFLQQGGWTLPADAAAVAQAIGGADEQFVTDYDATMTELQGLKTAYDNNANAIWLFI